MNTTYTKGKAESEVTLEGTPFTLLINTYKRSNGKLSTTVSAHKIEQNQGYRSMTCRIFQDFNYLAASVATRATEKAIRTQHESVLSNIKNIMDMAINHYTSPDYLNKYGADFEIKVAA